MTTEPPMTAGSEKSEKVDEERKSLKSGGNDGGDGRGSRAISGKSGKSGKNAEAGGRVIPSPIASTKDNPAADHRNMRRIIAEDPDWSLATVPLLVELVIKHIVENFESKIIILIAFSPRVLHF